MKLENKLSSINPERHDLLYMVDINDDFFPTKVNKLRYVPSIEFFLSSSPDASSYSTTSRKKWGKSDSQIPLQFGKKLFHWDYCKNAALKNNPYMELLKFGYKEKVTFEVDCFDNAMLTGRFYILLKDGELLKSDAEMSELKQQLEIIHHELYENNRDYLNPFLDFGVVSSRDMKLLSHLAHGTRRSDISDICSLTMRGIDYRITRLKEKFDARNCAHLIRIAVENNLIRAV